MVISRRVDSSFLARREKVLGGNNGDWPRSWATVIRPEDESDKRYGRLMHSESGWLLGMRYDDRCYLAYHLPTGQFLGHGDIESISPFLLMNADTVPEPRDVAGLVERLVENPSAGPGRPNESVLREALTHANPHVRDIARQLLAVLEGHELPE